MAFLRSGLFEDTQATVETHRLWLRPYLLSDYEVWAALRAESRDHLTPWEPAWPRDDLTKLAYRRRVRHYQREAREDLGYAFAILDAATDNLLGGLSICNVRRGVTQSAVLGYWLGQRHAGRGLMTEAVTAFLPYAFDSLRLHRIEAVTQPENKPSIRVLEKCGFTREGYGRRMIKINGIWTDHLMFAVLADDLDRGGRR